VVPIAFGDVEGITGLKQHFIAFEFRKERKPLRYSFQFAKINRGMHRSRDLVKPIVLVLIEEQYPLLTLKMAEQKVNPVTVVVNSGVAAGGAKKVRGNFGNADTKRAKSGCISVFKSRRVGPKVKNEQPFIR